MNKKRCSVCKANRDLSQFNKNKERKDGLQTHCKKCSRERSRAYYASNTAKHSATTMARTKKVRIETQERVVRLMLERGCKDCGTRDLMVLEFDHVRGKKTAMVGNLVREGRGWKRVAEEIAKCDVVCANCHRIRTFERSGNTYRTRLAFLANVKVGGSSQA